MVRRCHLLRQTLRTRWEQVDGQDIERWMVYLLGRYSHAYASNQYRALQQFFKWRAAEEELPDPMARLRPPKVTDKLVPVFTSGELSGSGESLRGPRLRAAPRRCDHRGVPGDRHPAGRAGRDPLRPRRPAA